MSSALDENNFIFMKNDSFEYDFLILSRIASERLNFLLYVEQSSTFYGVQFYFLPLSPPDRKEFISVTSRIFAYVSDSKSA